MQQRILHSFGLLSVIAICGCGGGGGGADIDPNTPPPTPVSGTVTMGGEPLSGATVIFSPTEGTLGSGGTGITNDAGKYEAKSMTSGGKFQPGIAPGKYTIKFSKIVDASGKVVVPNPDEGPMTGGGREDIPPDYSLKGAFTVEVTKEKKDGYDFTLEKKK